MTVTVTLPDGGSDEYLRSGDSYVKNGDGTLDVVRVVGETPPVRLISAGRMKTSPVVVG